MSEKTNICIMGLPPDTERYELKQIFSQFGHIKSIRVCHNYHVAFVHYCNEEHAQDAIDARDQSFLNGYRIKVAWSKQQDK